MGQGQGLNELINREAIRDLMVRYYSAVDRRNFEGVGRCFTPDAVVDFDGPIANGAGEILAYTSQIGRWPTSTHFMGNHLVELKGDRAKVETYAVATLRTVAEGREVDLVSGLRYLDEMVQTDEGWLIGRRVMVHDWRRSDPVPWA